MTTPSAAPDTHKFLTGGGKLGEIIAHHDWSATSLGPITGWSAALKTTIGLILRSPVPIVTLWNEDGVMIYNDAYSVFAGGRHPHLLGSKVREGWPEVASFNDHVMRVCLAGGTLAYQDQELTLYRSGMAESVWMNLDYSPVLGEDGAPIGVIAIVVETTAKVRAERRLSGEHARLQAMFEQAPGFMAMLSGPEHVITQANKAYLELVGHRNVLEQPVRAVLPEAVEQGFVAVLDEIYATGRTYAGSEVPFALQQGGGAAASDHFLDVVFQPLKNEQDQVVGIFVQGADVSDRVRAEQLVRDSEARFRSWAQAMPNQVWSAPADGVLDWFNDQVYDYTGAPSGSLDGVAWASVVLADDLAPAEALWAAAVASGATYQTEFRIRRADGAYRWHLVRAVPIRGDDGQIVRWIGTSTDIDDQKATERALEYLNATLEQQVQQRTAERDGMWQFSTDIMLLADGAARISSVNPALGAILGWSAQELLGRGFAELVHPDERAAAERDLAAAAAGGATFRFSSRYRCKDGAYKTIAWSGAAGDGGLHAVGRDITAEQEAADAMRQTELALRQAQKMETIGKLTGGVAHDFNNLLQVISGNLQLLATDIDGNVRAERRLANALSGVARGAKLASYLLAFGRRQALEPKVVKLSRLLSAMEDMLRRSLGEEIEVETIISGGLWNTFVDSAQVENAILNLSINARDAMDGRGKLTIEVGNAFLDETYADQHNEVAAGQYVILAVSDTGSGMTPQVLEQAFEPFFSTKPEGKGSGLGLSMVYGFVKQSGGHVKIYSEVGHGTTVKLYLPRALETEDLTVGSDNAQPVVGGAETVLVAEDDEEVRSTVVELLGDLGYRVLKANDAASALTIIDSGIPIDLLFTDVVMPGPLRSPDLARKARERLPNIAVLFTSGYTENAIVHGGRLDAGVDLLSKPYSKEALAQKIRRVLNNQQQLLRVAAASVAKPVASVAPASELAAPNSPSPSSPPNSPPLKVLLVEDDELVRVNTAELLDYLGHAVLQAGDAAAALALLAEQAIDVMITDVGLPGMSGDLLALRARELRPALGVVFATGQDVATAVPGAVLLRKPYDTVTLARTLLEVV